MPFSNYNASFHSQPAATPVPTAPTAHAAIKPFITAKRAHDPAHLELQKDGNTPLFSFFSISNPEYGGQVDIKKISYGLENEYIKVPSPVKEMNNQQSLLQATYDDISMNNSVVERTIFICCSMSNKN